MVSRRPDPCGADARDEHCLNYTSSTRWQQTTRCVVRLCETRVSLSCSMTRTSSICGSLDTGGVLATRKRRAGYSARQRPLLTACPRPVMWLESRLQTPTGHDQAAHATGPPPTPPPVLAACSRPVAWLERRFQEPTGSAQAARAMRPPPSPPGGLFQAGCVAGKTFSAVRGPCPGSGRDATPPLLSRRPVPGRSRRWKAVFSRPRASARRRARCDPPLPTGGLFQAGSEGERIIWPTVRGRY